MIGEMLRDIEHTAAESPRLVMEVRDEEEMFRAHAVHGRAAALSRHVSASADAFAIANELTKKTDADGDELHGLGDCWWAHLLLLADHATLAARRLRTNRLIRERLHWNSDVARCHHLLAACALAANRQDDAESESRLAEPILHRGQMLDELARLFVTAGDVALARQDAAYAIHSATEAPNLAAPRGMRLVHADALILRGHARLLEGTTDSPARALDDAEEGCRLARECGYVWAERDGLFLQADALIALTRREPARRVRADAEALAAKLVLTAADLADAESKAKAWLAGWEKQAPGAPAP